MRTLALVNHHSRKALGDTGRVALLILGARAGYNPVANWVNNQVGREFLPMTDFGAWIGALVSAGAVEAILRLGGGRALDQEQLDVATSTKSLAQAIIDNKNVAEKALQEASVTAAFSPAGTDIKVTPALAIAQVDQAIAKMKAPPSAAPAPQAAAG